MVVRRRRREPTLRRYTDLAAAIHTLQTKSLTILDPEKWDDGNDKFTIGEFKERRKLKSVLALCFAECTETYHHWKVFAPGMSGICIEFEKDPLIAAFDQLDGVQHRTVEYRKVDLSKLGDPWRVEDLPFLKRWPYQPEAEYRVIFCSHDEGIKAVNVDIQVAWIKTIKLSPWMPKDLQSSVRTTLRLIDGCKHLPVQSTSLISSDMWKFRVKGSI